MPNGTHRKVVLGLAADCCGDRDEVVEERLQAEQ
jgi:hypothetical protein